MVLKTLTKIFGIIWIIIGVLIIYWTGFWYYQILTVGDLGGVLATTVLMAMGFYMLAFYIPITIILVILYYVFKKKKKHKRKK